MAVFEWTICGAREKFCVFCERQGKPLMTLGLSPGSAFKSHSW